MSVVTVSALHDGEPVGDHLFRPASWVLRKERRKLWGLVRRGRRIKAKLMVVRRRPRLRLVDDSLLSLPGYSLVVRL